MQFGAAAALRRQYEYQLDFVVITDAGSFLIDVGREEPQPPPWIRAGGDH